jgi:RNA polymerase sigma-70 factor (ECF subfamily)
MGSATQDRDREDVRRVLAGEVDRFERIVRRWQGPLVNLAFRYCRHPGVAEELAQEAFVRVFRFLDRWRDESSFSSWLFAVALNVYRSHARRTRPHELPLEDAPPTAVPADATEGLERSERHEAVRRAVCALPPRYRDVMILFYFLEADIHETSRVLGVAQGTVKARLHRGRALLKRRLDRAIRSPREVLA